jgi:hypothetical protein
MGVEENTELEVKGGGLDVNNGKVADTDVEFWDVVFGYRMSDKLAKNYGE